MARTISCLLEAAAHRLTLVTYDRRTIPPLLKTWAGAGRQHGGVIFVDEKTISPADIGALVLALSNLAKEAGKVGLDRPCDLPPAITAAPSYIPRAAHLRLSKRSVNRVLGHHGADGLFRSRDDLVL